MTQYGPLHQPEDIWFSKLKFVVYARFKYEQDASTAYKMLEKKAAWLFNMAEVDFSTCPCTSCCMNKHAKRILCCIAVV